MRERERGQEEDLHLSCIEVCMLKSPGIRGSDIGLAMCFTAVVNRCGELSLTKRFPELCAGPIGSDMCAAFLGANRDLHLTVSGARGVVQLTSFSHFFSSAASSFYACLTWGATRFIRRFQGVTKLISICFLVVASHPVLAQDVALDTLRRETSAVAAVSRGSCSAAAMHQHLPSKQTSGRLISIDLR